MNLFKIAWFEYKRRIRSKWFILGTFGMPLLILALGLGGGFLMESDAGIDTRIYGLIDETNLFGEQLVARMDARYEGNSPPLILSLTKGSFAEVRPTFEPLIEDKTLDGFFVIPADFYQNAAVRLYARSSSNFKLTEIVESELKDLLVHERASQLDLSQETLEAIFVKVEMDHYDLGTDAEIASEALIADYMAPVVFMMLLFFGIFTGGQLLLRAVLEERSSRVIEVLLSTVTYNDLMGGKILGLGLLGLTQSIIYLIIASVAGSQYGITLVTAPVTSLYLVYFILGYLLYAGIYIGTGALFDSEQEAQQAIQIISFMAMIPMMLWMFVIQNPNSPVVNMLCYFPPMTPFFMMVKVAMGETTALQISSTILILSISVYGSIRMAAKIFKTAILLYGKRVTLPEIYRWIRY
jgi:ABC-2 type transport system permease protein